MGGRTQLGVCWDRETICFTQVENKKVTQVFSLPVSPVEFAELEDIPLDQKQYSLNQKITELLKSHKISSGQINIALPIRDIIFRTFVIPFMKAEEVGGVVQFEANKYMPFNIDELTYDYHSIPTTINGIKKLRIVFVGIRKILLERYRKLFEDAGLQIEKVEPGAVSLIRLLLSRKEISGDDVIAILEQERESGKVTIVRGGVPLFVREFQTKTSGAALAGTEQQMKQRFVNEVRVSLDYFSRQDKMDIRKIKLISHGDSQEFFGVIQEDLGLPVEQTQLSSLIPDMAVEAIGHVKALGVCEEFSLPAAFDLSRIQERVPDDFFAEAIVPKREINLKSTIIVVSVCLPLLLAAFVIGRVPLLKARQDLLKSQQSLGKFSSLSADQLRAQIQDIENRVDEVRQITIATETAALVDAIASSVPRNNIWLERISIDYMADPQINGKITPVIEISGYAYSEETKYHFTMIEDFAEQLKENVVMKKFFDREKIKRDNTNSRSLEGHDVTYFSFRCQ